MGKTSKAKTPPGDFKVTTPENPLLSQQVVTSKGIPVPYIRHGKTGQNFLTRPDPTRKIPDPNSIFLTLSKNGLTRDLTRFFCRLTRPNPNNP